MCALSREDVGVERRSPPLRGSRQGKVYVVFDWRYATADRGGVAVSGQRGEHPRLAEWTSEWVEPLGEHLCHGQESGLAGAESAERRRGPRYLRSAVKHGATLARVHARELPTGAAVPEASRMEMGEVERWNACRRALGAGGAAVLVLGLASGCSPRDDSSTPPTPTVGEVTSADEPSSAPASTRGTSTPGSPSSEETVTGVPPLGPGPVVSVPSGGTGELSEALDVALTRVEATEGTASGVGEISGPALLVTLTIRNLSDREVSLDGVTVNAYAGSDAAPARTYAEDDRQVPFADIVAASSSVDAVYLFGLPEGSDRLTVAVLAPDGSTTAVFEDVAAPR